MAAPDPTHAVLQRALKCPLTPIPVIGKFLSVWAEAAFMSDDPPRNESLQNNSINETLVYRVKSWGMHMAQDGIRDFVTSRYNDDTSNIHDQLIDKVSSALLRLAESGWSELFLCHGLDIGADDLAAKLAKPLTIDRSQPGFGDFSGEATRAIEPGQPSRSLLYHAFASPEVTEYSLKGHRKALDDFPTLAEIEAVENYVYGAVAPSIKELRVRAKGAPLAIVVFASEYRPAVDTVHQRHADMCFSRTGVARIGMRAADYSGSARGFTTLRQGDWRSMAVLPARYAAYIAALLPGEKDGHGPMHYVEAKSRPAAGAAHVGKNAGRRPAAVDIAKGETPDDQRQFWMPLHKLFDGKECIRGFDIRLGLSANHRNEKLRRAHMFFGSHGHDGGWHEPDISEHPFVITKGIAEFSADPHHGTGLLEPMPHPLLVEAADYKGAPLTYQVPATTPGAPWELYASSLNLIAVNDDARRAPEYLHARHRIDANGVETNLNKAADVATVVGDGNYRARHYLDYTGDGWTLRNAALWR